ncbi:polysaccharide deacetylase family protein [Verrucomicrobium spinosum]|uniref:polysaccharide deacetylase family protein n=1 Tax=Verrucomicrobium spinosum TaxID=2736 RepID=UPI002109BF14|nr:polysaccharide deacetylase family protein [Verrucomicrobium spinosum]
MLPGVEILPGLRDTDHFEIAKVPPPSVKASYSTVHMTQPYVAITFDDGPHATNTPRLLDILAERNIKATFFVVGKNVREYPAILRRIIAEGHEVGNHTWSHMALSTLTPDKVRQELSKTHDAVLQAAGYQMRLMRPPYGATNLRVKQICFQEFHYPSIIWTVDPLDWKQPGSAIVAQHIVLGHTRCHHPRSRYPCRDHRCDARHPRHPPGPRLPLCDSQPAPESGRQVPRHLHGSHGHSGPRAGTDHAYSCRRHRQWYRCQSRFHDTQ